MELCNIRIICNSRREYEDVLRPVLKELGVIWRSGKDLYSSSAVSWDKSYPDLIIEGGRLVRATKLWSSDRDYDTYSVQEFISAFDPAEIEPLPSDLSSLFE